VDYPAAVLVPRLLLTSLVLMAPQLGCATQSQDLERARRHYQDLEFPKALALLRLLTDDRAGLSEDEVVQLAYLRGMTDARIADGLPPADRSRPIFRACSRDWLLLALGLPNGERALTPDQLQRARAFLAASTDIDAALGRCVPQDLQR
jgi:hypothetical protein